MIRKPVSVFLIILAFNQVQANLNQASMRDCLGSDFKVIVSHRTFPLGLLEKSISIAKTSCKLEITHESYFIYKQGWSVDVCREPIHLKVGARSVEVLRKKGVCTQKNSKDEFCNSILKLKTHLEDDGLIFSEGEKEDILSDHGKAYCAYALVQRYLFDNEILSRYEVPTNFISPHNRQVEPGAIVEIEEDKEIEIEKEDFKISELEKSKELVVKAPEEAISTAPPVVSEAIVPVEVDEQSSSEEPENGPLSIQDKVSNFFKSFF